MQWRGKGQAANVLRSVGTGIGDCERFLSPRVDCTVRHDAALLIHFSQRIRGSRHDGRTAGDAGGAVYGFILLEHYYSPRDLERQVAAFIDHYNHARYDESLGNLTPADVYFGRAEGILLERESIKRQPIAICSLNCRPHNLVHP